MGCGVYRKALVVCWAARWCSAESSASVVERMALSCWASVCAESLAEAVLLPLVRSDSRMDCVWTPWLLLPPGYVLQYMMVKLRAGSAAPVPPVWRLPYLLLLFTGNTLQAFLNYFKYVYKAIMRYKIIILLDINCILCIFTNTVCWFYCFFLLMFDFNK